MKTIFVLTVMLILTATTGFAGTNNYMQKERENANNAGAYYQRNGVITPATFKQVEAFAKSKGIKFADDSESWTAGHDGFYKIVSHWSGSSVKITYDGKIKYDSKIIGYWAE